MGIWFDDILFGILGICLIRSVVFYNRAWIDGSFAHCMKTTIY